MDFVLSRLGRRPFIRLLCVYAAVMLVNGAAVTDWYDFIFISSDVTHIRVTVDREFLYSSPLNFILASLLHLDSDAGFYILHPLEIVGMLFCVAISVRKKIALPEQQARFLILLSLAPLWLVTFKWLGKTDPVVIGGLFL